jgi:hypothetical protein
LTRGAVVLGMHRSGTSLATRLVGLLGLSVGEGPMVPATEGNPRGHWESAVLRDANDELLAQLGGNWAGPPVLDDGWEHDARLDATRVSAHTAFARVYGPTPAPWVWKDPRNCITLPFWELVLGVEPVVLVVHRNPLSVADSLARRDSLSKVVSLALWERYVRESLRHSCDHSVLIAPADEIVDDPVAWAGRVHDMLVDHGIELGRGAGPGALAASVDARLQGARHSAHDLAIDPVVSDEQRALFDVLAKVSGRSERFAVPDLPPPTPGADRLLAEHAHFYAERESLREQLAIAREYDQRIVNVRRLKIRVYRLYRRVFPDRRRG